MHKIDEIKQLNSLLQLQNTQLLESRVIELEDSVASINSTITILAQTLAMLQMDFQKDHTKLGAQDDFYKR